MADLYFNESRWRSLGLQDQEIFYLREMLSRVGGSQNISINLDEAGDLITNISESMNVLRAEIDKLRHRVQELENAQ